MIFLDGFILSLTFEWIFTKYALLLILIIAVSFSIPDFWLLNGV